MLFTVCPLDSTIAAGMVSAELHWNNLAFFHIILQFFSQRKTKYISVNTTAYSIFFSCIFVIFHLTMLNIETFGPCGTFLCGTCMLSLCLSGCSSFLPHYKDMHVGSVCDFINWLYCRNMATARGRTQLFTLCELGQ